MLTVRVIYIDGREEIKDCWDISDVCLDGVKEIRTIRDERTKKAA